MGSVRGLPNRGDQIPDLERPLGFRGDPDVSRPPTPQPGFEPGTNRLTVDGSTAELLWNEITSSFDTQVSPN